MTYHSGWLRSLYYALPLGLKNVFATAYGLRERRARYSREFHTWLRLLEESQHWDAEQLRRYQREQTIGFLRYAVDHVPYYRERSVYREVAEGAEFARLPVLAKRDVREAIRAFYTDELHSLPHRWMHTSGTTGTSLEFPVTRSAFQREYACRVLHNTWGGVRLNARDRIAFCAGHPVAQPDRKEPPFWVMDYANNMLLMSSYHLTQEHLPSYVDALTRFKPVMIAGYPSSLYILALACERYGVGRVRPRSLFSSSETLFAYQREKIEGVFGAHLFNYYGNTEMCANAMECEQGEIHLKMEYSGVEVLDQKNQPCGPGMPGRLVCTGFGNPAFPLIRYDIGDIVEIAEDQSSKCGRGGLLLKSIEGRVEDYVVTPDGRLVGRLDHIFKEAATVMEAQIVQNSVQEVILRMVKTTDFTARDEARIIAAARLRLGSAIGIRCEYVDHVPRGKNGKFRFIESRVDQEKVLKNLTR